ncbi:MAG TPA: hypothetical protein VII93_06550, partial [Anaerolineales bacterium]
KIPEIQALLIFTNPKVELKAEDAPIPALIADQVKDFIREKVKASPISEEMLSLISQALPQPEKEE